MVDREESGLGLLGGVPLCVLSGEDGSSSSLPKTLRMGRFGGISSPLTFEATKVGDLLHTAQDECYVLVRSRVLRMSKS